MSLPAIKGLVLPPGTPGYGPFQKYPALDTADLVVDRATGYVIKSRGENIHPERIVVVDSKENTVVGPLGDRTKLFAIEWETEESYPLWRLSDNHVLSVDITQDFNSKFRLVAYRNLEEEEALRLRQIAVDGGFTVTNREGALRSSNDILPVTNSIHGYTTDIFDHTDHPEKYSAGWLVTNNAHMVPGLKKRKLTGNAMLGQNFNSLLTRNPYDGFQVQFCQVPYPIFKRYWRKPIRLLSKWHAKYKTKYGRYNTASTAPCIEVLEINPTMLKMHKMFWADFSDMHRVKTRMGPDLKIVMWMIQHAPLFKVLTDEESPFVKNEHEFLFTMEWL